jgi:hypothetical protein
MNVMCFLLPAVLCLHIFGSFEAIMIAQWAQEIPDKTSQRATS